MKFISTLWGIVSIIVPVVADTVCRILSMSGGGSHGAFEMGGVTKLIETPGWKPWDVHLGVSAGSLGVVGLLKDDYQHNMEMVKSIWSEINTGDIIEPLKSKNSFSGNDKIKNLISETYDLLNGSPTGGIFEVGVTDLISGDFISLSLNPSNPNLTYVLASTSIPVIFPPSEIDVNGMKIMGVDGGLQKNEYYLTALQYCPSGTTSYVMDIMFANYETDTYNPSSWNWWTITTRSLELIMNDFDDLYFKDLGECSDIPKKELGSLGLEIRIHQPPAPIWVKSLDFDHGELLWNLGYNNMTTTIRHC
jgi:predicted patatin/cPLA2 family phospholipase